jgi:hypothetical protein
MSVLSWQGGFAELAVSLLSAAWLVSTVGTDCIMGFDHRC